MILKRAALLLGFTSGLVACSPPVTGINVHVISKGCAGAPDAFAGADNVKITASTTLPKDDPGYFEPITATQSASSKSASLPKIPVGVSRVITVVAVQGDPDNGTVVGRGASAPFDVPEKASNTVSVTVFVRPANKFAGPADGSSSSCKNMLSARAGHTATLMGDGRVYIAGGFTNKGNLRDSSCTTDFWKCRTYWKSAEIFNPGASDPAQVFVKASDMQFERAYHTATLLPQQPGDRAPNILIAGGEQVANGAIRVIRAGEIYDPVGDQYGLNPLFEPRSHHSATLALDGSGRVFFAGGVTNYFGTSGPIATKTTEWFDPADPVSPFKPSDDMKAIVAGAVAPTARAFHAAVAMTGAVAIVGGTDFNDIWKTFVFYRWDPKNARYALYDDATVMDPALVMTDGRFGLMAVLSPSLPGDPPTKQIIIAGGFTALDRTAQSQSIEIADFNAAGGGGFNPPVVASQQTGARAQGCMVALPNGEVVLVGGYAGAAAGKSLQDAWRLKPQGTAILPSKVDPNDKAMAQGRYDMACTRMLDGSVLVTGGVVDDGTNATASGSAEIYTPKF